MSENKWIRILIFLNLVIINGVILAVLNLRYPLVGHDYTYAIPGFLDTALHYSLNGLGIEWFTPSFGGGIPAFPNPNNMQYSLPTFLGTFLPPWNTIMATVVIYVSSGFLACYYFFRRIVKLHWTAAILGAFFFSANGFAITRIATGQLGYFSFTLLGIIPIILFEEGIQIKSASLLLGVILAMYIYSAGYFIILIFGFSFLILAPILFLYRPELFRTKRLLAIISFGGMIGLVISASKLAATFSFMRYFPRLIGDDYPVSFILGSFGVVLQLLGTQSLVPLFILLGLDPSTYPNYSRAATGTHYGMWELDISMTPVVFLIIIVFGIQIFHNPSKYSHWFAPIQAKIALALVLLSTYITFEFILAKGVIYPLLRHLPILSSLRGNVRFTGAFIFPLAFLAATIFDHWSQMWGNEKKFNAYLLVNFVAILPLGFYFLFQEDMFWMFYNIAEPQRIYEEIRAGKSFEITSIGTPPGQNTGALLYRMSDLNLYDPVFGFKLEDFHPQIKSGPIWEISNGYYNMTDPTGFIYPDLNNNQPFDRFRVEDWQKLELFVKHFQPNWNIPNYQRVLNWASGATFIFSCFYIMTVIIIGKPPKT